MALRGNPWTNACLLIILTRVFGVCSLTCHPTEYQTGKKCCPMCPPGWRVKRDCTKAINTYCHPCGEGTYMDKANKQNVCISCSTCDSGCGLKVKQACTQTSDTVCEPLEGFKICKPGQHISKTGTSSSDTECSDCSTGTFSDGSFTSCQPHIRCETLNLQLIKAGTASADAECGEKSFTVVVIGVVVPALLICLTVVIIIIFYITKKGQKPVVLNFIKNKPKKDSSVEHKFVTKKAKPDPSEVSLMCPQNPNIREEEEGEVSLQEVVPG